MLFYNSIPMKFKISDPEFQTEIKNLPESVSEVQRNLVSVSVHLCYWPKLKYGNDHNPS